MWAAARSANQREPGHKNMTVNDYLPNNSFCQVIE